MSHLHGNPGVVKRWRAGTFRARDAERKLSILNEIIAAIHNETTLEGLLEAAKDATLRLLKLDFGGFYLVQPQTRIAEIVFEHAVPAGFYDLVRRVEIDREPYRTVLVRKRPIFTEHYERIAPPGEHDFGIRAVASVPLLAGDEVIGSLNVGSTRRFRTSKDDASILTSIGQEIGDAIGRLRDREQLQQQQKNLFTLVNSMNDLLFVIDSGGRLVAANDAVCVSTGYSRAEITGMNISDLFGRAAAGGSDPCTLSLQAKDGRKIEVETSVTKGQWDNQDVFFWVGRDVSEKIRADTAARESKERFRLAINQFPGTFRIYDAERKILFVNRFLLDLTGYREEEVLGRTDEEIFPPEVAEAYLPLLREAVGTKQPVQAESQVILNGTLHHVLVNYVPILDDHGEVEQILGIATGITRLKQAEDDVRKAHAELESRIRERTAELAAANYSLEEEIAWRKQVESALRKSEERSRILFNTINEGFALCELICDDDGALSDYRFLKVNPAFERMIEFTKEQLEGSTIRELMPEIDPSWVEPLTRVARTGEPVHYEYLCDRVGRWFEVSASSPEPGKFTQLLVDITERKQWEEALQESEDRYRSLVELSPDAILIHQDNRFVYVNPAGARLLGASDAQQIIGQRVMDIISPRYRSLVRRNIGFDLMGEDSPLTELEAQRLDGTRITIEGRGTRTYFKGRPAIQVFFRNITERKRAEKAVLSRNRQLSILNRFIGAVSSSLSLDELLETALGKALELLDLDAGLVTMGGSDREQAIPVCQRGLPDIHPDRLAATAQKFAITEGRPRFIGQDSQDPDEKALLNAMALSSLACIPLIVELEVVGSLFVGSRQKEAIRPEERALLKAIGHEVESRLLRGMLYQRLEEAHAEANLYLDIMTHDIRNAENVSGLYTELLIDTVTGEGADYARKLRASIRRSIDILGNVSTIRKIHQQSADLLLMRLDSVIRESIAGFPDADIRYGGSSIKVLADNLLSEVFSNLIGNAVKFGGPEVEIAIRIDERDGEVMVSVEDNGPGVPDVVKSAIFKRFERGKSAGRGEGLGLYITKTLVERYGGRVWVEDRVCGHPEKGAAFRVVLPGVEPRRQGGQDDGC